MGQLRYDTEFAIVHLPVSKDQPVNWTAIADEEYANKKICTRILRLRARPNTKFEPEEFKRTAMADMATSGEVAAFRNKAKEKITSHKDSRTGSHQSSRSNKVEKGDP